MPQKLREMLVVRECVVDDQGKARFDLRNQARMRQIQSGRGLPHSKTLVRATLGMLKFCPLGLEAGPVENFRIDCTLGLSSEGEIDHYLAGRTTDVAE